MIDEQQRSHQVGGLNPREISRQGSEDFSREGEIRGHPHLEQKRRKELRIAAWVLAVSLAVTPLFVAGARMNDPGLGQFLFIMGAIIAPVFALISAIGLSVRFFSE